MQKLRYMKGRAKTERVKVEENAQVRRTRKAAGTTVILFVPGTREIPYATARAIQPNFSMC